MTERYFVTEPIAGGSVALTGDEARHLMSVMRAKAGDEVTLFDGMGAEFAARVVDLRKHAVHLEIDGCREPQRELPVTLTLAVALPKGDRQKWLIEKATELGVTQIVPLVTERGVAQPVESALERLRRTVIEASKQCGRNRLMEIGAPLSVAELVIAVPPDSLQLWADPSGEPLPQVSVSAAGSQVYCAVGPEGGFTPDETAAAKNSGWRLVSLGPRILRIETAAIMLAAWATATLPLRQPGGE